ncbi:phosphotransferase [Niallia sp. 01092]|uniref:phosphotransferase n=1 Tax=unclassified Niallia TaxID=2837522 RepID=UPI003FD0C99F
MVSTIYTDIQKICKEFGIGKLKSIAGPLGGYANSNIKIETNKGAFVVRIFKENIEDERLHYANKMIARLCEAGIPALTPIRNVQNKSFSYYKLNKILVTPFVESMSFQWVPGQAYHSGKTLRKIHDALHSVKESPEPTGVYSYYNLPPKTIVKLLKEEGHKLPKNNQKDVDHLFDLINQQQTSAKDLPKTVIHGDWNPWNQLYHKNDLVSCVMDFDSLQIGERVFDVAYALYFILTHQMMDSLGKEFLHGYGELTEQEILILPVLIAKIGLFFGIFAGVGDFDLEKNKNQLEWVLSDDGQKRIYHLCNFQNGRHDHK